MFHFLDHGLGTADLASNPQVSQKYLEGYSANCQLRSSCPGSCDSRWKSLEDAMIGEKPLKAIRAEAEAKGKASDFAWRAS